MEGLLDSLTWLAFSYLEPNDLAVCVSAVSCMIVMLPQFVRKYLKEGCRELCLGFRPDGFLSSELGTLPTRLRKLLIMDDTLFIDLISKLVSKNAATLERLEVNSRSPLGRVLPLITHCRSVHLLYQPLQNALSPIP